MSRPKNIKDEVLNKLIAVRLSEVEYNLLNEISKQIKIDKSTIIRKLIKRYVHNKKYVIGLKNDK